LAQLGVPGGAAVKGARLLSAAGKAGRSLPLATDVAASTLHGGAQYQHDPEESRLKRALTGAAGAGIGAGVGKALNPFVGKSVIRTTDEADELIRRGVNLTPGQAADSKFIQNLESVMEVTPVLARGTKAARQRAQDEWGEMTLREVLPETLRPKINKSGAEGVDQLRNVIDDGYDEAWGKTGAFGKPKVSQKTIRKLTETDQRTVSRVVEEINGLRAKPETTARQIDQVLRRYMPEANDPDRFALYDALSEIRANYRASLPKSQQAKLKEMDEAWRKYLAVSQASSTAAEGGGYYTPKVLMQGARTMGGRESTGRGLSPMQDVARLGTATVGRSVGGQPLEWFRRVAGITPTPLPMQAIGDYMLGQNSIAKYMADQLRDSAAKRMAPYVATPARLGASFYNQPEYEE
jgi:hypothetical protein